MKLFDFFNLKGDLIMGIPDPVIVGTPTVDPTPDPAPAVDPLKGNDTQDPVVQDTTVNTGF